MLDDYALSLGGRLRAIRQQQGLSLHAVEEKSGGRWKAVVVGSYERGDRAITVAKLAELLPTLHNKRILFHCFAGFSHFPERWEAFATVSK